MSADAGRPTYGYSDEELIALPTVYRDGLFDGAVVLVSGAGTGLGKATAVLFARLGAKLVLCGRKAEKLAATAELIRRVGSDALEVAMNIRDPEQVAALFDAATERFERLDVVVNNAGASFRSRVSTSRSRVGTR